MLTQEAAGSNEFSFFDDFEVVGTAARDDTYALIVRKDSSYKTTEEFIAYAKANPGQVRYSVTYYGATHAVAEAMQQDFAALGIEVTIQSQDWNVFLQERKNGNYDFCREGWLADFNDPINMLEMWITDSGNNDCQYGRVG